MAHALHYARKTGGVPHGREFIIVVKDIASSVRKERKKLPAPYNGFDIDAKGIQRIKDNPIKILSK